jgi:hypothetical protein
MQKLQIAVWLRQIHFVIYCYCDGILLLSVMKVEGNSELDVEPSTMDSCAKMDPNLPEFPAISLASYYPLTLHLDGSNGPSRWRIKDPSIISRNRQDDKGLRYRSHHTSNIL